MVKAVDIGLCTGKDCRKADGFRTTERELRRCGGVRELACLDVCDGPVVVLGVRSDAPVVIERVNNRALALDVVDHVTEEDERHDRHDGDEAEDECVLSQALSFFLIVR